MEVIINYNGQALSVEVTVEVYEYLDRADHKTENLAHEQRRHWDGREFDEYIAFTRGERPVIDLKYNLLKHPNIRCTEDGGAAPYDYTAADNALDDLPGAPENYELLDMDDFLPAEAAEMKPTIQRIRRPK